MATAIWATLTAWAMMLTMATLGALYVGDWLAVAVLATGAAVACRMVVALEA